MLVVSPQGDEGVESVFNMTELFGLIWMYGCHYTVDGDLGVKVQQWKLARMLS
jgi:hypothetical protein